MGRIRRCGYTRSMRVMLVNWARVWDGAGVGGGVNGYAQALALELTDLGHEVHWISSGLMYTEGQGLHARRHPDWLGIRAIEIVNSPVMAPSIVQFKDPAAEASSPDLERLFAQILGWISPDVVHFQNIEGLSAGCVGAAADHPCRPAVVFSLHNYHTICPQVYLLQGHRRVCVNAEGGAACATCIPTPEPTTTRAERAAEWLAAPAQRPTIRAISAEVSSLLKPVAAAKAIPGVEVGGPADLAGPLPIGGGEADGRGRTARVVAERTPPEPRVRPLPILNDVTPDPSLASPLNEFGRRRAAMIGALNRCDRVLAVSEFVNEKYASVGVQRDRLLTQHIGTTLNRIVERRRSLAFAPAPFDVSRPRPVRMTFMGVNHWYKGLPFFLETLEALEPEVLARFHLSIFAQGAEQTEWMVRRLEPRLAGVRVQGGYDQADIPWILGGQDLGVVPSVWWDNAPQTVFEFLACSVPVLAANIGGIPDFLKHGENGLLFRANDAEDLAANLRRIAFEPGMLSDMRRRIRPPKDIGEHARELLGVYASCRHARAARSGAPQSGAATVSAQSGGAC
jgi:glycosyltransferase involved in cell wall biosynthesis